ncbi:MAG: hypothetical protein AAGB01_04750 [Cyanobacteria bacterium P01_F01_bin.42]
MGRKLGTLALLIGLTASGLAFAAWRHLARLPDWYGKPQAADQDSRVLRPEEFEGESERQQLAANLKQKLKPVLQGRGEPAHSSGQTKEPDEAQRSSQGRLIQKGNDVQSDASQDGNVQSRRSHNRTVQRRNDQDRHIRSSGQKNNTPKSNENIAIAPQVTLNEQDVNELIVVSANQSARTQPYLDGIKGISTEISAEKIKSEIVMNFAQVDRDRLPVRHVRMLENLASQFPLLAEQDILLSFNGKPQVTAGKLQLDPAMNVAVGGFQMTLADLFKRFGVDMDATPINLKLSELDIEEVEYTDGELVISGKG